MIKEKQKNRKIQRKRKIRCSQANLKKKTKQLKTKKIIERKYQIINQIKNNIKLKIAKRFKEHEKCDR